MKRLLLGIVAALLALGLGSPSARAQNNNCQAYFYYGNVLTAQQWIYCMSLKQDYAGASGTLAGNNTWTGVNNFTNLFEINGTVQNFPLSGNIVGTTDTQTLTNKSIAATELTGTLQAAQFPALTGDVTTSAGSLATTISANAVTNAKAAQMAANTIKGNPTGSTANSSDMPVPACASTGNVLTWTSGSGFTCVAPADVFPQGRLTLQSGHPVMTSDVTSGTTIYYDCFNSGHVPYYNGTSDQVDTIPSCEVSDALPANGTGAVNANDLFDEWYTGPVNAPRICHATNGSGGGWSSDTGGGLNNRGTGYTQLSLARVYWTNANSIADCYNGTTNEGPIAANEATYIGTFYTISAGTTEVLTQPASSSGGTAGLIGIWNAYNRVVVTALSRDTASFTYATSAWTTLHSSTTNRVSWVDGLAQSPARAQLSYSIGGSGGSATGAIGIDFDSVSATPGGITSGSELASSTSASSFASAASFANFGLNYAQAMMICVSAANCIYGSIGQGGLSLEIGM